MIAFTDLFIFNQYPFTRFNFSLNVSIEQKPTEYKICDSVKSSNFNKIQTFHLKCLHKLTKATFYVSNHTLHKDFFIPTVQLTIMIRSLNYLFLPSQAANES
uniref:Uncharacterized protein n=1 Tax=Schizaphis graminum TaxID=13262 RepID=A0A2S2NQ57_SCHGA